MATLIGVLDRGLRSFVSLAHPRLGPEQVAVARLLALTWLCTGHVTWSPGVRLPWCNSLAFAEGSQAWSLGQTASGLLATLVILFSPRVRTGCTWLACTIALGLASSRQEFAYNRLFVASLLVAIAAASGWGRALPRLQVAVLYLGAGLDKLLNADWRSGVFLSSFVQELARFGRLWAPGGFVGQPNVLAQLVWTRSPGVTFEVGSWLVILTELFLAAAFAWGSRRAAIPAVLLHVSIALLTGGTFGMFFFAGLASVLLVTGVAERRAWPGVEWLLSWPGLALIAAVSCLPWWSTLVALLVPALLLLGALLRGRSASARAVPAGFEEG